MTTHSFRVTFNDTEAMIVEALISRALRECAASGTDRLAVEGCYATVEVLRSISRKILDGAVLTSTSSWLNPEPGNCT